MAEEAHPPAGAAPVGAGISQETAGSARGMVVAGLMLTMGLAAMDGTIVATAIPSIVKDLGGFSLFPWIFSVYLLIQAVTIPIYGKLSDMYGRRPILLIGSGIFLLGSVLSGVSWSMPALIAFRGIQGIGAGAVQPISMTVIGDLFTIEERARMQGYFSSVWGISAIVGPTVGGLLVQYASWHWIFYLNLPVGAGALWLIARHLKETVVRKTHHIDYSGAGLLVAGVGLLVLGLLQGGVAWSWTSPQSMVVFAAGVGLLVAFVVAERRAGEPILPLWVFGDRLLLAANLASLVVGVVTIGLSSYLPTYVEGVIGGTPLVAGFALGAMSLGWPVSSSQAGRLYLKIGFRSTALLGTAISSAAAVGLLTLGMHSTALVTGVFSLVMGLGMGLYSTSVLVSIQSAVDWGRRGVVTGANMFTRMLGSTLGVAVYGGLVNSTLAAWLADPPKRIAGQLPRSLNATAMAMGTPPTVGGGTSAAIAYVREGINLGIHHVFVGVLLAALVAFGCILWMPRGGDVRAAQGDR